MGELSHASGLGLSVGPITWVTAQQIRQAWARRSAERRQMLPGLARGVELLGLYEGTGLRDDRYLARRPDGRILMLTPLLYLTALHLRERGAHEVSAAVSAQFGKRVSPDGVAFLTYNRLAPLGLLAGSEDAAPEEIQDKRALALSARLGVLPPALVQWITGRLRRLFAPGLVVAVLLAIAAFDWWLFSSQSIVAAAVQVVGQPRRLLVVVAIMLAASAFHELGHGAACRYGGGRPGAIGVGFYLVWPVFFCNVTDAHRLDRAGRLRTDLGGLYFNAIFILATGAFYAMTGASTVLVAIAVQHLQIVQQLMPFVRFDGYYVMSDLAGVPDLFDRAVPIARSLIPGARKPSSVTELTRRARVLATGWLLLTIPALAVGAGVALWGLPRYVTLLRSSFLARVAVPGAALADHRLAVAALSLIDIVVLVGPALGITAMAVRGGRSLIRYRRKASLAKDSPPPVRTPERLAVSPHVMAMLDENGPHWR